MFAKDIDIKIIERLVNSVSGDTDISMIEFNCGYILHSKTSYDDIVKLESEKLKAEFAKDYSEFSSKLDSYFDGLQKP